MENLLRVTLSLLFVFFCALATMSLGSRQANGGPLQIKVPVNGGQASLGVDFSIPIKKPVEVGCSTKFLEGAADVFAVSHSPCKFLRLEGKGQICQAKVSVSTKASALADKKAKLQLCCDRVNRKQLSFPNHCRQISLQAISSPKNKPKAPAPAPPSTPKKKPSAPAPKKTSAPKNKPSSSNPVPPPSPKPVPPPSPKPVPPPSPDPVPPPSPDPVPPPSPPPSPDPVPPPSPDPVPPPSPDPKGTFAYESSGVSISNATLSLIKGENCNGVIVLKNIGLGPITAMGLTVSDNLQPYVDFSGCGDSLPSGQTCEIHYSIPEVIESSTAEIKAVGDNADNEPAVLPVIMVLQPDRGTGDGSSDDKEEDSEGAYGYTKGIPWVVTEKSEPTMPLGPIDDIALGELGGCFLVRGGLKCWVSAAKSQRNNDDKMAATTPMAVLVMNGLEKLKNVQKVAIGSEHACAIIVLAISPDRYLVCLGANDYGQLGNGESGPGAVSMDPVLVMAVSADLKADVPQPRLTGVLDVVVGDDFTCTLLENREVACLGRNNVGQLGVDAGVEYSAVPVVVQTFLPRSRGDWFWNLLGLGSTRALREVFSIAAGSAHILALVPNPDTPNEKMVIAWGDNRYGQLGNGVSGKGQFSRKPTRVLAIGGQPGTSLSAVEKVAAGGGDSCVVFNHGAAACWGDDVDGQLGDGIMGGERDYPEGVRAAAGKMLLLRNIEAIAVGGKLGGGGHTIALQRSDEHSCIVLSWGKGQHGELGDGSFGPSAGSSVPVTVLAANKTGNLTAVITLFAGPGSSCGLLEEQWAVCWGEGYGD